MKKIYILSLLLFGMFVSTFAQTGNVGIGTNTPDNSSILDITSSDKGLLIPRVSISNVSTFGLSGGTSTAGMVVYNTNASITGGYGVGFYFWGGSSWTKIATGNPVQATLTNGRVWIGNASNVPTEQTISGDATISNAGVLDLSNGAVETSEIADNAVTTIKINDGAVTTPKIADNAVTTIKINDAAVTTVKINDNAVTTPKIADNAVTTVKINDNAVTTPKIADNAVTTVKINDAAVTTAKIANNAVDGTKINLTGNTNGDLMYYNGTDWVRLASGTSGQILRTNGAGAPTWSDPNALFTFQNGLTETAPNIVELGGALTKATTISGLSALIK